MMKKVLPIEGIVGLKNIWGVRVAYYFFLEHFGLWWWHFTEGNEAKLLRKWIKPGATVVDVGANIGYYTLLLAQLVGPTGKVFAFEPEPGNFCFLEKNIKRRNCKNVVYLNQAVSDQSGPVQLFISEKNPGDHRLVDFNENRKSITVSAVRLDDYFAENLVKLDFIKIDVQGAEDRVISGMSKLLKDPSKTEKLVMLAEFWPKGLQNFGVVPPEKYLSRLNEEGFSIFYADKDSLKEFHADKVPKDHWKDKYINLFCFRS